MNSNKRILVIGSSNIDFITTVPKLPAPGETVTGGVFSQHFGGKGANQAVAAARAGGNVAFIACVGQDSFGEAMLQNFVRDNIDCSHIKRSEQPSGNALILVDPRGNNVIAVSPGANSALLPEHLRPEHFADVSIVVMQMEIAQHTVERALDLAAKSGARVLFNFAPVHSKLAVSSKMHGLIINETEAAGLSGVAVSNLDDARQAARVLLARGPHFIALTLGGDGVWVLTQESEFHVPAFEVTPVDTTAAGDTFCGALSVALAEEQTLHEAVVFASAAAAISVTRAGAQTSIPQRADIEAFISSPLATR